jgi:hypothetical protein
LANKKENEATVNIIAGSSSGYLTEDAENWICNVVGDYCEPTIKPKAKYPAYPLALVTKWGFDVVDEKRYDEIVKDYCVWDKAREERIAKYREEAAKGQ